MVKLLMQWDIQPGREASYLEFVTQTFTPRLGELGLELSEVWYTYWGESPQLMVGFLSESLEEMGEVLGQPEWTELQGHLQEYVTNYRQKIIPAQGPFQL